MYTIKFINCLLNFPPLTCLSVCFFQFGVFEMSNNFWGNLGRSLLRQGYPNSDDPIASMIQDFFGESYARTDNNHTRSTSEPTTFNYTHHRNPALAQHQPSSAARQTSESITTPSSHSCHRNSTSSQQQLTTVAVAATPNGNDRSISPIPIPSRGLFSFTLSNNTNEENTSNSMLMQMLPRVRTKMEYLGLSHKLEDTITLHPSLAKQVQDLVNNSVTS